MPVKPHLPDADADVPPHVIRQVLQLLASRGHSADRLCKGLGFTPENLCDAGFRVSYRQTSMLVRRAMQRWGDPAIGIATGARQTVVCFGLPGLGTLTCPTLGEALLYLIKYQRAAGALTINELAVVDERHFTIEVSNRFHDPELEPFFIEEIFVSGVAVARAMVGSHFRPARLALRYPRPIYASAYSEYFGCPVVFNAPLNRLICDMTWYHCPLPTHDHASWEALRGRISTTLQETYQSKARCNDDTRALQCLNAPVLRTGEARSKADFRLGWDNANGKFGIALLVNNLFDKQYVHTLDGQTKPFGLPYAIVTPPRTVSLEVRGSL